MTQETEQAPVKRTRKTAAAKAPARAKPTAAVTAMDLLARAMDRKFTAEQLQAFIEMVERQRKVDAEQAYIRAMLDFKTNDLPEILRNATGVLEGEQGQAVEYDYATLDRICGLLIPALAKHRIIHSWEPLQPYGETSTITISTVLTHELGHSQRATLQGPPDFTNGKNNVQAIGSTTTYLERYTLLAVCGIAVSQQRDDDGRAAGTPVKLGRPDWAYQANDAADRRQQPRTSTYVTMGQHPISEPDLVRAIANIQGGRYTIQKLGEAYALTRAQMERVHADLGLPAPAEEMPS